MRKAVVGLLDWIGRGQTAVALAKFIGVSSSVGWIAAVVAWWERLSWTGVGVAGAVCWGIGIVTLLCLQELRAKHGWFADALPDTRPKMAPIRYGRSDTDGALGVIFKNQGEDAYDVTVPSVAIQDRRLVIAGSWNHVASGDEFFCDLYVETPDGVELGGAKSVLRQLGVNEIAIQAHYRDFDHNWYTTAFTLVRNPMVNGGVQVGPFKQTRASGPPVP
jgi:hypothetical protein